MTDLPDSSDDVDRFLAQLALDRDRPYWADRRTQLDAVETWLLSLRDHLDTPTSPPMDLPGVAAGGWCAPTSTLYDPSLLGVRSYDVISFPTVSVQRGGLTYKTLTPAERAARDADQARITRAVIAAADARNAAEDAACATALANGWDLDIYDPPTPYDITRATTQDLIYLRSVGIGFRPARYSVPTITRHTAPDDWDDDTWDRDEDTTWCPRCDWWVQTGSPASNDLMLRQHTKTEHGDTSDH